MPRRAAAVLVFLAASAGAGFVAPDLRLVAADLLHHVVSTGAGRSRRFGDRAGGAGTAADRAERPVIHRDTAAIGNEEDRQQDDDDQAEDQADGFQRSLPSGSATARPAAAVEKSQLLGS